MIFEFREFAKIARLFRPVIITEKIDGTNACVIVSDDGNEVAAQSRTKLITPEADNFGFARWVKENADELKKLGPGHHFGEWWGQGIQRNYDLKEKRFSLFNVLRWEAEHPKCCHVVPILYREADFADAKGAIAFLRRNGSQASPGFMKPEGIVVFHIAGNLMFKATLEKDEEYKGKSAGVSNQPRSKDISR